MSAPRPPGVSVDALRAAAGELRKRTSLRVAAARIGIAPSVLNGFLKGARPYARTLETLADWYLDEHAREGTPPSADGAEMALSRLARHLTPAQQQAVLPLLLDLVESMGRGQSIEPPEWVGEMRQRTRKGPGPSPREG